MNSAAHLCPSRRTIPAYHCDILQAEGISAWSMLDMVDEAAYSYQSVGGTRRGYADNNVG